MGASAARYIGSFPTALAAALAYDAEADRLNRSTARNCSGLRSTSTRKRRPNGDPKIKRKNRRGIKTKVGPVGCNVDGRSRTRSSGDAGDSGGDGGGGGGSKGACVSTEDGTPRNGTVGNMGSGGAAQSSNENKGATGCTHLDIPQYWFTPTFEKFADIEARARKLASGKCVTRDDPSCVRGRTRFSVRKTKKEEQQIMPQGGAQLLQLPQKRPITKITKVEELLLQDVTVLRAAQGPRT